MLFVNEAMRALPVAEKAVALRSETAVELVRRIREEIRERAEETE